MKALLMGLLIALMGLAPTGTTNAGQSSHGHPKGHKHRHAKAGKKTKGKKTKGKKTKGKKTKGKKINGKKINGKKTKSKKINGKKINGNKAGAGKKLKPSNSNGKFHKGTLQDLAATNKNLTPAQRGALFAGMSGFPLSDSQRNALSELAADGSGLSSEEREAVNWLLEQDAEKDDEQLAADDDTDGPVQLQRFLLLRNETGEPLTIRVQFRMKTSHGDWNWVPADPRRSQDAVKYTLRPGKALYLKDGESRVATSKVRIWVEGLDTGSKWEEYKDQDFWLVPEVIKGEHHGYHDDKIQTVSMRLTQLEDSQELLSVVARR